MGGRGSSSSTANSILTIKQKIENRITKSYENFSSGIANRIPDSILEKNLSQGELLAWRSSGSSGSISKETEKAYLVKNSTDYGTLSIWVPKSALKSSNQIKKEAIKKETAFELGQRYNNYLKETAISNGVKGIKQNSKTTTVIEKLKNANVKYKTKDEYGNSKTQATKSKESVKKQNVGIKIKKGNTVSTAFGKGKITDVKNGIVTVKLENGTIKKIMQDFI